MPWRLGAATLIVCLASLAGGAKADSNALQSTQDLSDLIPGPCMCRFQGQRLPVGTSVCLETPQGARRALCIMQQNSPSWLIGEERCPSV